MDSTPASTIRPQTHPLSIEASSSKSKLPIKRKTSDSSSSLIPSPQIETAINSVDYDDADTTATTTTSSPAGEIGRPPPFKFHRIWTEQEEIRFLQCLLDCSNEGLFFPKDLGVFYARFSATMPQPYTKCQLSEKLRRLRKKFRVISSRLARGLDLANLSLHDRSLYELSKQLWDPDNAPTSPFYSSTKQMKSNFVGVEVSFSPTLPSTSASNPTTVPIQESNEPDCLNCSVNNNNDDHKGNELSEVNVEFEDGVRGEEVVVHGGIDGGIEEVTGKIVIDVFENSLNEVRMDLAREEEVSNAPNSDGSSKEGKVEAFERRWREQKVAELDVFARRLRLILQ